MYVELSMSTVSSGCCRSHYHHNHKYLIHLLVPLSSLSRSARSSSLYPTNQSSHGSLRLRRNLAATSCLFGTYTSIKESLGHAKDSGGVRITV